MGASENGGQTVYNYAYDRFANRWQQNGPHTMMLTFGANNDNRTDPANGYSYDAAGNMLNDSSHTYTYDAESRIVSADGGAITYEYDAGGRRVRKTVGGASTDYVYDLAGHAIAEVNASGWQRGEVYAGGKHLATYTNNTTYFNHADWLGTERVRTAVNGSVCESIISLPFGDGMSTSGSCGDPSARHFTGKQRDTETNLDDFDARYYSSQYGRFISADWSAVPAPVPYANLTNTQTCTYTHDDLSRIASGNCGSIWSQTFSYDAFGNITKAGTNSFSPGYNTATNRMSSGATYDAVGDVLTDSLHSYAWNSDTRPTTIDSISVTYDALGRMVEQGNAGTFTEIQYSPTGFKMQLMHGATFVKEWVPMPGGTAEVWQATGMSPYYQHADWLGSSRFASTASRTMYNDLAYAPFGEQYAQSGTTGVTNTSFGGNNQDTAANLYDAQFREYEIYGRWPSPDPAGVAAVDPSNPQSWNRYAYVLNMPLIFVDPLGLQDRPPSSLLPSYSCQNLYLPGSLPINPFLLGGAGDPYACAGAGIPLELFGGPGSHPGGGPLPSNRTPQQPTNCQPNPVSETQKAEAAAEVALLTSEFFSGFGQGDQTFGPNTATAQVMAQSAGVQDALNEYTMTGQTSDLENFGLTGLAEAGSNPVAQFVGSFRWTITPTSGGLNMTLTNTTSFKSLTYDHGPQWQRGINTPFGTIPTPMGNIHQVINIFIPCK